LARFEDFFLGGGGGEREGENQENCYKITKRRAEDFFIKKQAKKKIIFFKEEEKEREGERNNFVWNEPGELGSWNMIFAQMIPSDEIAALLLSCSSYRQELNKKIYIYIFIDSPWACIFKVFCLQ
jgi:hypothetical protein